MPVKEESMERMGFTLPPKHAEAVRELVTVGEYGSEAEVLRDAVRIFLQVRGRMAELGGIKLPVMEKKESTPETKTEVHA